MPSNSPSDRIARLREEHREIPNEKRTPAFPEDANCLGCGQAWPCDVAVLLEALDAAVMERDSFEGQAEYERLARIAAADFPRNRHGYIPCERCGLDCGMDAIIQTELWALIAPDPESLGGMLCLWCMDELLAERGVKNAPVALYFPGRALLSLLYDDDSELRTRDGSPWNVATLSGEATQ